MFNKTEIYVAVNYITHLMSCRAQSKHYTVGQGHNTVDSRVKLLADK